jgi:hypothetical protein
MFFTYLKILQKNFFIGLETSKLLFINFISPVVNNKSFRKIDKLDDIFKLKEALEVRIIVEHDKFKDINKEISEFYNKLERMNLKNVYTFKIYQEDVCTKKEIECFASFYPLYLSIGNEYFNNWGTKKIKYFTFSFEEGNEYPLLIENLYSNLIQIVQKKFEQNNWKNLEYSKNLNNSGEWILTSVKMIHNPNLLEAHRSKFLELFQKFNQENTENIPQHIIAFHGTLQDNIPLIFKKGLDGTPNKQDEGFYGAGNYLTSYPQYAMYYGKKNQPLEILSIIGGFYLPGKFERVKKIEHGKSWSNFDSRFVRTNNFHQEKKEKKEEEDSDEMVFADSSLFYPCFQLDFRLRKNTTFFIRSLAYPKLYLSIDDKMKVVVSDKKTTWTLTEDNHLKSESGKFLNVNLSKVDKTHKFEDVMIYHPRDKDIQKWNIFGDKIILFLDSKVLEVTEAKTVRIEMEKNNSKKQQWAIEFIEPSPKSEIELINETTQLLFNVDTLNVTFTGYDKSKFKFLLQDNIKRLHVEKTFDEFFKVETELCSEHIEYKNNFLNGQNVEEIKILNQIDKLNQLELYVNELKNYPKVFKVWISKVTLGLEKKIEKIKEVKEEKFTSIQATNVGIQTKNCKRKKIVCISDTHGLHDKYIIPYGDIL